MASDKENYIQRLNKGNLNNKVIDDVIGFMGKRGLSVKKLPAEIVKRIGQKLHLDLRVCRGNKSWEGLVVGFPGTIEDLSTQNVGTPFLRKILYPLLFLQREVKLHYARPMPCLYLVGSRFNDVFLRKFSFLNSLVSHVIVMSGDLRNWEERKAGHIPIEPATSINEYCLQKSLCEQMKSNDGLVLPLGRDGNIRSGQLPYEVPTVAATENKERMDILGYDRDDHSFLVVEIKGQDAEKAELENLFFQGMEHRNWLEENKMAVKFAREGPRGKKINFRKRVKLVLGFCGETVPKLFIDLKTEALRKDRFLQIGFCRLIPPDNKTGPTKVESFSV